jgi:hypothetical protein
LASYTANVSSTCISVYMVLIWRVGPSWCESQASSVTPAPALMDVALSLSNSFERVSTPTVMVVSWCKRWYGPSHDVRACMHLFAYSTLIAHDDSVEGCMHECEHCCHGDPVRRCLITHRQHRRRTSIRTTLSISSVTSPTSYSTPPSGPS